MIKVTHVWNHFPHFREISFMRVVLPLPVFTGIQSYTDQDMSSLSNPRSVFSLNVIFVVL